MKVILFDLGQTLEDQDELLPGVGLMLTAVAGLRDDHGQPPGLGLISDFDMPHVPADVPVIRQRYLEIIKGLGIRHFFDPVSRGVTLSSEVGVFKPDERVFRSALDKFSPDLEFGAAMFVTEHLGHVTAARTLGMRAVHFKGPGQVSGDFTNWPDFVTLARDFIAPPQDRTKVDSYPTASAGNSASIKGANPFDGLEPRDLWTHFAEFTRIARPSGQEAGMIKYVQTWAKAHKFEVASDAARNIRVRVPASKGHEGWPRVILQGHMDMVCTRDADAGPYDPTLGKMRVCRAKEQGGVIVEAQDGDWLKAEKTSLGADNGVGVASMLALAVDPKAVHGPLDILLTVEEEAGLVGASKLDPSIVDGKIMLNLDSEEHGVLTIGNAGGQSTEISWSRAPSPIAEGCVALSVFVSGLRGGHSGVEINTGRLNAIKVLTRVLQRAADRVTLRAASIQGGDRPNAIPREARATVVLHNQDETALRDAIAKETSSLAAQYKGLEDGLSVKVEALPMPAIAYTISQTHSLLGLLRALPSGVIAMSQALQGLVETSNNLGVVATNERDIEITCSSRSSVTESLEDITATLVAIAEISGARAIPSPTYPGWNPDPASGTLKVIKAEYARIFGKEPSVAAVHAGLECGLLKAKLPTADIVSFGPTVIGAHSTRERVFIPSVNGFYRLLLASLAEFAA